MVKEEEIKEIEAQGRTLTAAQAVAHLRAKGYKISERSLFRKLKELREKKGKEDESQESGG